MGMGKGSTSETGMGGHGCWTSPSLSMLLSSSSPQSNIFRWYSQVDTDTNMAYSANYADGSWTAVRIERDEGGNQNRGFNRTVFQEKFGQGCRNNTAHPHETVR